MDVSQYPTGTFTLTSPIDLASLPAAGVIKSYTAHGKLTLHGTTRAVTFTLTAERRTGITRSRWPVTSRCCSPTTTSRTRASRAS